MNRKYNIAMAALAVYAAFFTTGCGKNELPQMTEMTVSGTSASETEKIYPVHDIDPMAAEHGADGLPFFYADENSECTFIPTEDKVRFDGRYIRYNDICWLSYTCSAVSFVMTGDKITAELVSNGGAYTNRQQGWLGVMINGELMNRIRLEDGEQSYVLYEGELENAEVTIIKLSENQMSCTGIKSITCNAKKLARAADRDISIEFIGDSITCGYGNEAEGPSEHFDTDYQNGAATYGFYTAQALDADWSMVSISGMGLISDYTDTVGVKEDYLLAGDIYDYADVNFEQRRGIEPLTQWDFGGGSDIIVINLGTNDYSYTGRNEGLQDEFYRAYYDFIGHIREKNPDSEIICTMGIMGAELFGQIERAVGDYSEDNGDEHIHAMKFDYQTEEDGYGADYHPTVKTHQKAAEQLTEYIKGLGIVQNSH